MQVSALSSSRPRAPQLPHDHRHAADPYRSMSGRGPAGASFTKCGVRALAASQSAIVMGHPAAFAMAVRCSTVFVEPPKAMSHSMALCTAAAFTMSRAHARSTSSITFMPACFARRMRSEYTAGTVPLPGSAIPKASHKQFMEFAVNMPEQLPQVGHAVSS